MSAEDKAVAQELAELLPLIPKDKREYLRGYAAGIVDAQDQKEDE